MYPYATRITATANRSEQLKEDNNIRADIDPKELELEAPLSVEELKRNVRQFLHPDLEEITGSGTKEEPKL